MYKGFITPVEMPRNKVELTHRCPIILLGSCFAENMGRRLEANKFACDTNPFGVLYNPISIAEAAERIAKGERYGEDAPELIEHEGQWHSLMHHSDFSAGTKQECLTHINSRLDNAHKLFQRAGMMLVTFGSAYIYRYRLTGRIVGNCHKLPERHFIRQRLTPEEIVETYTQLIGRLAQTNPDIHWLFTVSPIRHLRDGLHANQLSKSTLLLAIDRLIELMPDKCSYFPAYEIMMDELRDYRFYADDMMHPTPLAVEHIWKRFADTFFSRQTKELLQEWEKIRQALAHRPFRPEGEAYRQFLRQTESEIGRLKEKYPTFDVENELEICRTRLNK